MKHRPAEDFYSLKDLCRDAQVTERTVRYYIQEGLLPPPEGAGPFARYGRDHLLRLRLIRRLKEEYLPLAEIRRRLEILNSDELEELAQQMTLSEEQEEVEELQDAKSYLDRLLNREKPLPSQPHTMLPGSNWPSVAPSMPQSQVQSRSKRVPDNYALNLEAHAKVDEGETWQRITLAPGVELHYQPQDQEQRDQIARLLEQARQIFNS
jgi:DNA-binding transcriptional MerR regulator